MFARTHDILLKFRGRSQAQDRMIWIVADEGRDCYVLQTYRLCCKCRDGLNFHARAFAASTTCASLPVAPHVPVAHAFARQQVQGNQGEWLHVDYILIDFVGPSMKSWLMTINHRRTAASSDMLRKAFLSLMVLCHRSHQSKLPWDQELFSRSVCYDVVKRRWFGRCYHFARADSTYPLHKSVLQSCAAPRAGVAGIYVCPSRCALRLCPVARLVVHSFGRDRSIGHRCCRHCGKSRPRSPRPDVNRCVSILTQCGKKSDAKQMTLERWQKKSAVMPHVSALSSNELFVLRSHSCK